MSDKANTMWRVEGKHDPAVPIIYGQLPTGMQETVQVKPLAEGEFYLVFVASLVGATFRILDGKVVVIKR